jgi:hypothetical protein
MHHGIETRERDPTGCFLPGPKCQCQNSISVKSRLHVVAKCWMSSQRFQLPACRDPQKAFEATACTQSLWVSRVMKNDPADDRCCALVKRPMLVRWHPTFNSLMTHCANVSRVQLGPQSRSNDQRRLRQQRTMVTQGTVENATRKERDEKKGAGFSQQGPWLLNP